MNKEISANKSEESNDDDDLGVASSTSAQNLILGSNSVTSETIADFQGAPL